MEIGDLFYYDVAYEDDPSQYKNRPVLLLDKDENEVLMLISTTTKGRGNLFKYHDYYKIPIPDWRKAGLREASWCRGKVLISAPKEEVEANLSSEDYIGRIQPSDFNFILKELEKIHSSPSKSHL